MRTLAELAQAYPNPMHSQKKQTDALLDAIRRDDAAAAAEAAAALAYQIERSGLGQSLEALDNDQLEHAPEELVEWDEDMARAFLGVLDD